MSATTTPSWVARSRSDGEFEESWQALGRARVAVPGLSGRERHEAMITAMTWALYGGGAPISGLHKASTEDVARIESDAALLVAARGRGLRAEEWQQLGYDEAPRYTVGDTAEYAYGVWRVFAWLLGDIQAAPPVEDTSRWPRLPPAVRAEVEHAIRVRAEARRG